MSPYMEAWLINQSDYIIPRDEYGNKTVYLGPYTAPSRAHLHEPPTHYVLYALNCGDHGFSVGAHYGEQPWEYLSGEIYHYDTTTAPHVFASEPLLVAMVRYLLNEKFGKEFDYE